MKILELLDSEPDEWLLTLRGAPELIRQLAAFENVSASVLARAVELYDTEPPSSVSLGARAVLDYTVAELINRPRDILALVTALQSDAAALRFLQIYVRHHLSSNAVLVGLARLPEVFAQLPKDDGWVEVVVYQHGSALLNEFPQRQFSIGELLPLGVDADRLASRSILSSALDSDQLTPEAIECARALYPHDDRLGRQ